MAYTYLGSKSEFLWRTALHLDVRTNQSTSINQSYVYYLSITSSITSTPPFYHTAVLQGGPVHVHLNTTSPDRRGGTHWTHLPAELLWGVWEFKYSLLTLCRPGWGPERARSPGDPQHSPNSGLRHFNLVNNNRQYPRNYYCTLRIASLLCMYWKSWCSCCFFLFVFVSMRSNKKVCFKGKFCETKDT